MSSEGRKNYYWMGVLGTRTDEIIQDQAQNIQAWVQTIDNKHGVIIPISYSSWSRMRGVGVKYLGKGRAFQLWRVSIQNFYSFFTAFSLQNMMIDFYEKLNIPF